MRTRSKTKNKIEIRWTRNGTGADISVGTGTVNRKFEKLE